jgi:hypothetical protein
MMRPSFRVLRETAKMKGDSKEVEVIMQYTPGNPGRGIPPSLPLP